MRALWLPLALVLAGLVGCDSDKDGIKNREEKKLGLDPRSKDTDGDGLGDSDELDIGTDPLHPDTDRDWLLDGDEIEANTDPKNPDTDDDGYLDGDEIFEGSDPRDPSVLIYRGGWPYFRLKDDIDQARVTDSLQVGARIPRFTVEDQFGDVVDLYDFAGQGKDIILQISGADNGPDYRVAGWLAGTPDPLYESWFGDLRAGIDAGEVYWLNFVYESYHEPTEARSSLTTEWYQTFRNKQVPMFTDADLGFWDYAWRGGSPFFIRLNEGLVVQSYALGFGAETPPLLEAQERLSAE